MLPRYIKWLPYVLFKRLNYNQAKDTKELLTTIEDIINLNRYEKQSIYDQLIRKAKPIHRPIN